MKPLDFIGAIELAYDRSQHDDIAWLEDVTRLVAPAFSAGATTSFFYKLVNEEAEISNAVSVGEQPHLLSDYERMHKVGRVEAKQPTRIAYECDMFTLLSRVIGEEAASASIRASGMKGDDSLGLRANMTADSGLIITTFVERGFRIRNRNLWTRFASHLGSALRLRLLQGGPPSPESALAVLSPRGRLEHFNRETIEEDVILNARGELTDAAKDIDRARGKMRRLDQEGASALWRAMVRGEWSLVDWFDHDGKRFLLAQSNRIPTTPIDKTTSGGRKKKVALTDREHQVVACASMGHSNKLIAYDLGLSTGTISVILTRAAAKLGVSGRVALIRAFREQMVAPAAEE